MKKIINLQKKIITLTLIFVISLCLVNNFVSLQIVKADSYRYSYDGTNLDTNKYPGFKEKIDALKVAHPSWKFVIMETGLDWNQAIKAEYAGHWGSPLSLIQGKSGEWICPICGTHAYDNGSWYHASEKTIKYYMDARNWLNLNSPYVLEFMETTYVDTSDENVYNALNGTFLGTMEIAKTINSVCKETNTNPYFIIARLIQEQGTAGGATWKMESNGTYYYNLFNIGASGNSSSEIVANALAKAQSKGWTSLEASLRSGINFLFAEYVGAKQDTQYLNKFDVESYNGTYSHQYMQNIQAPTSEALTMYNKINGTEIMNQSLTFVIPVFENMPTEISGMPDSDAELGPRNVRIKDGHGDISVRQSRSKDSASLKIINSWDNEIIVVSERYNDGWDRVLLTDGTVGYIYFDTSYMEDINSVTNCDETVTLTGDGVCMRSGPGKIEPIVTTLSVGQVVTRIDNSGRYSFDGIIWDRIKLADGREGFVSNKYLKTVDYSETYTISAGGGLFLRDSPNGTAIRVLGDGTTVTRQEIAESQVGGYYWDKVVTADGVIGYVAREYLRDQNGNVPSGKENINSKEANTKKDDDLKTIKMEPNVTVADLKTTYGDSIVITKSDGTVVIEGTIGTGYKITLNSNVYTAIKLGDVNGDGLVKAIDYMLIKNYIMAPDKTNLSDDQKKAADADNDGKTNPTASDYMRIKNYIMSVTQINI